MANEPTYFLVGRKKVSYYKENLPGGHSDMLVVPDQVKDARDSVHRPVVVDIDLTDPTEIQAIKTLNLKDASGQERIFLVAPKSRAAEMQARALGATRIVSSPKDIRLSLAVGAKAVPTGGKESVKAPGLVSVTAANAGLSAGFDGVLSGRALDLTAVFQSSSDVLAGIAEVGIGPWLETVRQYHSGTYQHCLLVTGVAAAFATELGLGDAEAKLLTAGALLHDIGKAKIPIEILDKPSALSPEERQIMAFHPVYGSQHLQKTPGVSADILAMVRSHHELLDGSGYPDRLTGDRIPQAVRMLTIADIFAALVEERAYKQPMPAQDALTILTGMAEVGKLDGKLVQRFGAVAARMA